MDFDPQVALSQAGGDTPAPPAPSVSSAPAAPGPATPPTSTTPASATAGAPEDRSNWVPPYRVREYADQVRQLREQLNAAQQYRQQAETYQRQIQALTGVQNPNVDPRADAIKEQLFQLLPWLKDVDAKAAKLQQLIDQSDDMQYAVNHIWQSHAQTALDRLFQEAETSIGAPLNDQAKALLHSALYGHMQSNPGMEEQYAKNPAFIKEFWKAFSSSFVDPVRRASTAATVQRVPQGLPQDTAAAAPLTPGPRPASMDERVAQAWAAFSNR